MSEAGGGLSKLAKEHYPLLASLFVFAASVWIVSPLGDFPILDDWVYALDAVRTARQGTLSFLGIESAWGIPQVALGALVGPGPGIHVRLRALGVLASALVIVGLYLLASRATRDKKIVLLLLLGLVSFPPFFLCSISFMSDNFFLLFVVLTCVLLEAALSRVSKACLAAACFCSALALLQRQFGILLAVPILYCSLVHARRDRRFALIGLFGGGALASVQLFAHWWWMNHTAAQSSPRIFFGLDWSREAALVQSLLFLAGWVLAPLCLAWTNPPAARPQTGAAGQRLRTIGPWVVIIVGVGLAVHRLIHDVNAPFVGNLFSAFGVLREEEVLSGTRDVALPLYFRTALSALTLCLLVPVAMFLRRGRADAKTRKLLDAPPFGTPTVIFGLLYAGVTVARSAFFDRYFLPLIPALFIVGVSLFKGESTWRRMAPGVLLVLALQAYTVTTCLDYFSWNAVKWQLAERARRELAPAADVDGGYEWNGWNGNILTAHPRYARATRRFFVSFSPLPRTTVVWSENWRSIWPPRERKLYLLATGGGPR